MAVHYNAFISYKHAPADIAVAKEIQHRLEHYRVPKSIREKTGKEKIERIFRDQEELPITSDLNRDIAYALEDAEYLIVICSTSTKLSTWVPLEIAKFLETHDRSRVLTVLVDGEPNDVIPQMLREEKVTETDEGGVSREVTRIFEPLSCDYRDFRIGRKTEIPRLAAALLGCSYDELVMRARQYKMRRMGILGAVIGTLAAIAIGYLIWSNAQIREQYQRAEDNYRLAQENYQLAQTNFELSETNRLQAEANWQQAEENLEQARRSHITLLANESIKAKGNEERILAVQLALEALPGEGREDWPQMPLAEYALMRSVNAYSPYCDGSSYAATWDMEMRGNILDYKTHWGSNHVYAVDFYDEIAAWDLTDYHELFWLKPDRDVRSIEAVDLEDGPGLLVDVMTGVFMADGDTGETLWTFDESRFEAEGIRLSSCETKVVSDRIYAFIQGYLPEENVFTDSHPFFMVCRLDPDTGEILWESEKAEGSIGQDVRCISPDDETLIFGCGYNNGGILYACGPESPALREITLEKAFLLIVHLFSTGDGRIVVYGIEKGEEHTGSDVVAGVTLLVPRNATLICVDTNDGSTLWESGFTSTALQYLMEERACHTLDHVDPEGVEHRLLLIIHGQTVRLFDAADGSLYEEYLLEASPVSMNPAVDGSMFLSVLRNGNLIRYTLDRAEQISSPKINTETAYQARLCFPHNGDMGFVVKTDRTRLQLFEYLYDGDANYFQEEDIYTSLSDQRSVLYQDRYLVVWEKNKYDGLYTIDLYDLADKKRVFRVRDGFDGYTLDLVGLDPSGRYLVVAQSVSYRVMVFDTRSDEEDPQPVFSMNTREDLGESFSACRLYGNRICFLMNRYSWERKTVHLRFCEIGDDGSLTETEDVEVPLDPGADYYSVFSYASYGTGEDSTRFVTVVQGSLGDAGSPLVIHLYDTETGEWIRPDFTTVDSRVGMDYLAEQDLFVLCDGQKAEVFNRKGEKLYSVSDSSRTIKAFCFCPAARYRGDEDLLLVAARDEDYRMDRFRAADGTFLGSTDVLYYSDESERSSWHITDGEVVLRLDDVISFIDTEEWVMSGGSPLCVAYSPGHRMVISRELYDDYRLVWYPRYTLEELMAKGQEFLKGLEMSDSVKSLYGIE